jgi:four helix bundle protein
VIVSALQRPVPDKNNTRENTMEKKPNIIKEKSYQFAIEITRLYKTLQVQNEYVLSKQLVRSGTSIGANVEEATAAQSRKDFISKMSIASKEARETRYWLRLLKDSKIAEKIDFSAPLKKSEDIINILTAIIKTGQQKNKSTAA